MQCYVNIFSEIKFTQASLDIEIDLKLTQEKINLQEYLTLSPPKLKMSFGTTFTLSIIIAVKKQIIEPINTIC